MTDRSKTSKRAAQMVKPLVVIAAALSLSACQYFVAPEEQPGFAASAEPVSQVGGPNPDWVADAAEIIPDAAEAALRAKVMKLEEKTGHQLVVVTVPDMGGQTVEDYTIQLARKWGVGRKDHDDGVMLLVAPKERRLRIEVGYGLECDMPNKDTKAIIDENITPSFKTGDFVGGIEAGVSKLTEMMEAAPADTRKIAEAIKGRGPERPDPCIAITAGNGAIEG